MEYEKKPLSKRETREIGREKNIKMAKSTKRFSRSAESTSGRKGSLKHLILKERKE
jgi:hypothetical protein